MTNEAAASATCALTTRVAAAEETFLAVNLGEAIEPLRMGGVTFYGESARVIRDAQGVLQAAGAGQLEVVKRANKRGEPFVVIDGQVFISEAVVGKAKVSAFAVDHSQCSVKLDMKSGQYLVAGIQPEKPKVIIAQELLDEIQRQISNSTLGADLESRIAQIEKAGPKQGAENRALHDRLTALELDLVATKGRADAERIGIEQRLSALEHRVTQQRTALGGWPGTTLLGSAPGNSCATASSQPKPE